eukprot:scaffold930_cov408-Prasinococcus_capsulatus_cf.AAC.4
MAAVAPPVLPRNMQQRNSAQAKQWAAARASKLEHARILREQRRREDGESLLPLSGLDSRQEAQQVGQCTASDAAGELEAKVEHLQEQVQLLEQTLAHERADKLRLQKLMEQLEETQNTASATNLCGGLTRAVATPSNTRVGGQFDDDADKPLASYGWSSLGGAKSGPQRLRRRTDSRQCQSLLALKQRYGPRGAPEGGSPSRRPLVHPLFGMAVVIV